MFKISKLSSNTDLSPILMLIVGFVSFSIARYNGLKFNIYKSDKVLEITGGF